MKIEESLKKVLDYLDKYVSNNGFPPSVREICSDLKIKSTASAYYYLNKLESLNLIRKVKDKKRAIEIVNSKYKIDAGSVVKIPVVGQVSCGKPIFAAENIVDDFVISNVFNKDELFILEAKGDSMVNAGIFDKDYLVIKRQSSAKNSDIVAALLADDNEATVKRFFKTDSQIILRPENPKYSDIIVSGNVEILGIVVGLVRTF